MIRTMKRKKVSWSDGFKPSRERKGNIQQFETMKGLKEKVRQAEVSEEEARQRALVWHNDVIDKEHQKLLRHSFHRRRKQRKIMSL